MNFSPQKFPIFSEFLMVLAFLGRMLRFSVGVSFVKNGLNFELGNCLPTVANFGFSLAAAMANNIITGALLGGAFVGSLQEVFHSVNALLDKKKAHSNPPISRFSFKIGDFLKHKMAKSSKNPQISHSSSIAPALVCQKRPSFSTSSLHSSSQISTLFPPKSHCSSQKWRKSSFLDPPKSHFLMVFFREKSGSPKNPYFLGSLFGAISKNGQNPKIFGNSPFSDSPK